MPPLLTLQPCVASPHPIPTPPTAVAFLGASLSAEFTLLVLELCEGGALSANLAAGRVNWYKRGKQVGGQRGGAAPLPLAPRLALPGGQQAGGWPAHPQAWWLHPKRAWRRVALRRLRWTWHAGWPTCTAAA